MIPVYFVCNYLLKVHQRLPSLYRPLAQELRHPLQCRDDFSSPFKRAKTSQCKYQQRKHGIQPRTHIISKWYHPRQEGGQQWIVVANQHVYPLLKILTLIQFCGLKHACSESISRENFWYYNSSWFCKNSGPWKKSYTVCAVCSLYVTMC